MRAAEERCHELLEQGRVHLWRDTPEMSVAVVAGRGGFYEVVATSDRVTCSCEAKGARCSHILAAMCLWYERDLAVGAGLVAA